MAEVVPIYYHTADYAREHDELPEYRASLKAHVECRDAIDAAIARHFKNDHLDEEALQEVVEQFGYERTLYVLANTIRHKDWDARFSRDNHRWAGEVPNDSNDTVSLRYISNSHSYILNGFVNMARKGYLLAQQQGQMPRMSMM